ATGSAQGFAERASQNVNSPKYSAIFMGAASGFPHESDRVAVINQHQGAVFFRELADALQIRNGAVHREDAIGGNQLEARLGGRRFAQLRLEIGHVVVPISVALSFAQSDAVDDR